LIIEKDAFIGPNCVIATTGNRTLRIGEGAVIGAGVVVTRSVPPRIFLAQEPAKPIADVRVPLPKAIKMEDFVRGLVPIKAKTF
jgi:acetyltransferase-like isoleucine patch superfamily enzyme